VAPPVYWHSRSPGHDTRVIPPFLHARVTSPERTLTITTLWYSQVSPDGFRQGFFPLYDQQRAGASGHLALAPFWLHGWSEDHDVRASLGWARWVSRRDSSSLTVAGPMVWPRGPDRSGFGIVPVYYSGHGRGSASRLIGPVYWDHTAS